MSATACVSAADPERQHQIVSWTWVSLSVTRLAMYAPVVVLLSAPLCHQSVPCLIYEEIQHKPRITPSLKLMAMLIDVSLIAIRLSYERPHIEVPKLETWLAGI